MCYLVKEWGPHNNSEMTQLPLGKRFIRKLGADDMYLMTGNGLNYEPNTSKGSDFLTSLFPVALYNELLVVRAWLREKGKEWELSHTGKDRCMQACSHTHTHSHIRA